jgi:hypothetical protein
MSDKPLYIFKKTPGDIPKFFKMLKIDILNISTYNKMPQYNLEITGIDDRSLLLAVGMVKGKTRFTTTVMMRPYEGFEAIFTESKIDKKGMLPQNMVENLIATLNYEIKTAIDATLKGLE